MNKYVIMGVQGCGKGTQGKLLCESLNLTHIAVGDILRWNISNHTKLGARIKRLVAAGELVPDEVVADIVFKFLSKHDWNYGFVLDGFPRNKTQAEFFLESYDIDAVINIEMPDEVVMRRVLSRRLCDNCGLDYNLIHHRPEKADICDVCGGNLVSRADDTPESLIARLDDFHKKTKPVLDLFARKELIITVDGTGSVEEVQGTIAMHLNL